jgi:hypothetical protein
MYIALLLSTLFSSALSWDPSCLVYKTSTTGTAYFNFQHKTTVNGSDGTQSYTKYQRNNDLYFQLVQYGNDQYGHYVSFNDYNQTRVFTNDTLKSIMYSGVYCSSSSYKPKELSKLWVKNYTGSYPLSLDTNETTKFFTSSVTLKCQSPYCYSYDFETQQYVDCTDTVYFPSVVGIKANFSLSPLPSSYAYNSACQYQYTYTNQTASCTSPSVYGYGYEYTTLNTTLLSVAFNSKPYRVKSLLRMNYFKTASGSIDANGQYYSVCGEECTLLPVA